MIARLREITELESMASPTLASGSAVLELQLDAAERCIRGVEMEPLLRGELKLLTYLGRHPRMWHSSRALSVRVYEREDAAALQLVWKYASTLRKKLGKELPGLIELCRRRGYRCTRAVIVIGEDRA